MEQCDFYRHAMMGSRLRWYVSVCTYNIKKYSSRKSNSTSSRQEHMLHKSRSIMFAGRIKASSSPFSPLRQPYWPSHCDP